MTTWRPPKIYVSHFRFWTEVRWRGGRAGDVMVEWNRCRRKVGTKQLVGDGPFEAQTLKMGTVQRFFIRIVLLAARMDYDHGVYDHRRLDL